MRHGLVRLHVTLTQINDADGERRVAPELKRAAEVLNSTPNGIQLRYLQALGQISRFDNNTIFFPLPEDVVEAMKRKMEN